MGRWSSNSCFAWFGLIYGEKLCSKSSREKSDFLFRLSTFHWTWVSKNVKVSCILVCLQGGFSLLWFEWNRNETFKEHTLPSSTVMPLVLGSGTELFLVQATNLSMSRKQPKAVFISLQVQWHLLKNSDRIKILESFKHITWPYFFFFDKKGYMYLQYSLSPCVSRYCMQTNCHHHVQYSALVRSIKL